MALSVPVGLRPSLSVKSIRSAGVSWQSIGRGCRSMKMSENSPESAWRQMAFELTSSVEGSRARTSAAPAERLVLEAAAADYGLTIFGSFATYDRNSQSWRTSQISLLGGLTEFSETWPRSGLMRNGTLFRLAPLALPTSETASGLLPTPKASQGGVEWDKVHGRNRKGANLKTALVKALLPTPRRCSGARSSGSNRTELYEATGGVIGVTTLRRFVEWMMGYEAGWTDLAHSETPSSRKSRNSSAEQSCKQKA